MARNRFRTPALIALLATSLSLTPLVVLSAEQSAMPEHAARMPHGIDQLPTELKLTPDQQALFERARSKMGEVMGSIRNSHHELSVQAKAELAKPHPDLAALAGERDKIDSADQALRKTAQQEWLSFYNSLSPEQVTLLKPRLSRMLGFFGGHGKQGEFAKHHPADKS